MVAGEAMAENENFKGGYVRRGGNKSDAWPLETNIKVQEARGSKSAKERGGIIKHLRNKERGDGAKKEEIHGGWCPVYENDCPGTLSSLSPYPVRKPLHCIN